MALKIPAALIGGSASETQDISSLKTAVGDANSGLVKAVADLQTAVGDANSGLVHDVAAITVPDVSSFVTSSDVENIITSMVDASALKQGE